MNAGTRFWRSVLVVAALLVSSLIAEAMVRVVAPELNPSGQIAFSAWSVDGPVLGPPGATRRQTKNTGDYDVTVTIGPDGFRESRVLRRSTISDYFVVGDSFAFGWGVEESERFSNRLERSTGTSVFNIAIPGADLVGYERLVDWSIARGAHVRHLVVEICMENDLRDYGWIGRSTGAGGEASSKPAAHRTSILGAARTAALRLRERSALYALVTRVAHGKPALEWLATRLRLVRLNLDGIPVNVPDSAVLDSSVQRCAALAARFETTFVVVASRGLWVGQNSQRESAVHREFIARMSAAGLDVLDLRPVFESRRDPLSLHFFRDGHWNALGHALAARALEQHLMKRPAP